MRSLALLLAACQAGAERDIAHYHEADGQPIARLEPAWHYVAAAFVLFVRDRFGSDQLVALARDLARTRSFDASCERVLGVTSAELATRWATAY